MRTKTIEELLEKNDLTYNVEDFDIFFYSNNTNLEVVRGLLIDVHCGLGLIRGQLPEGYHAYAIRHSDYDDMEPATLEMNEAIVNFYGYFICRENLDEMFKGKDYIELADYDFAMESRPMI